MRFQKYAGSSLALLAAVGALVLGVGTGIASAATASNHQSLASVPRLVAHMTKTEYVSAVLPTDRIAFSSTAKEVTAGETPQISCGQVLTDNISISWYIWGTGIRLMSLSSTDYTVWCSGKVYTQSYSIYCQNLTYGIYNFTCLGGNSSGVTGQGTSQVNPWYNQPVQLTYWAGRWVVRTGTGYGRNYMSSNGATNEWFQLNI
jgi:hypothetical protein